MTYTFKDIPQPTDLISNSQGDINNNYRYQQVAINKDHQCVFGHQASDLAGQGTQGEGRHRQISLLDGGAAPSIATADNVDSMLWSHGGNLFWKNATVATTYQLTTANSGAGFGINPGWTFLPGGLIVQYGAGTASTSGDSNFYTFAFPNNVFSILATPVGLAATFSIVTQNFSTSKFKAYSNTGTPNIYYIVIGN